MTPVSVSGCVSGNVSDFGLHSMTFLPNLSWRSSRYFRAVVSFTSSLLAMPE